MTEMTANAIAELRSRSEMSQSAFAAKVGTSQPTISQYESGRKSPTLATLERMARSCDVVPVIDFIPSPGVVGRCARRHLTAIAGLEHAWLVGSYARLAAGERVVPGDIDILVVGSVDRLDRARLESAIGTDLDMRVDVVVVTPQEWAANATGFVQDVRASPRRKIL